MSEPTREQKCADLARAMGWDFIPASSEIALPDVGEWYTPLGKIYGDEPPDYFTDHADCHDLVVWMAEDNARWSDFYATLEAALEIPESEIRRWRVMWCMTAEPAIKAEAAWQAINAAEQPKAS